MPEFLWQPDGETCLSMKASSGRFWGRLGLAWISPGLEGGSSEPSVCLCTAGPDWQSGNQVPALKAVPHWNSRPPGCFELISSCRGEGIPGPQKKSSVPDVPTRPCGLLAFHEAEGRPSGGILQCTVSLQLCTNATFLPALHTQCPPETCTPCLALASGHLRPI